MIVNNFVGPTAPLRHTGGQYVRHTSCRDGKWFIVASGPDGYLYDFEVTNYDAEGLAWLEANEEKRG